MVSLDMISQNRVAVVAKPNRCRRKTNQIRKFDNPVALFGFR